MLDKVRQINEAGKIAKKALKLLAEVEWGNDGKCPWCSYTATSGHAKWCRYRQFVNIEFKDSEAN